MKYLTLLLMALCTAGCNPAKKNGETVEDSNEVILFIGTYTLKEGHVDGKGEGVYVYAMNKQTGALRYLATSDRTISPSYLAVHPNGKWVYAVNEYQAEKDSFATVTAFQYNPEDHSLSELNKVSSMGQYPCHLSIDNTGKFIMAANYVGGSVVLLPLHKDGLIANYTSYKKHKGGSSHPRQEAPHAHQIIQHPSHNRVVAVDLGANRIYEYALDTLSQTLNNVVEYPNTPMSGPRHIAFHPNINVAYILNELSGTIEVTPATDSGRFSNIIQSVSTKESNDIRFAASAAIKVHPNGRFLYASNRGELNEIVVFRIGKKGKLEFVGRHSTLGKVPRDFEIDPSGRFLLVANQNSGTIVTFAIATKTGLLSPTGNIAQVPTPVCIKFRKEK